MDCPGESRRLKKSLQKARRLAKKLKIATTGSAFTPRELPVCDQDPRDSLFIAYDGIVAPCISLALGGPRLFRGKKSPCRRYAMDACPTMISWIYDKQTPAGFTGTDLRSAFESMTIPLSGI
jgi:hypothetical protein